MRPAVAGARSVMLSSMGAVTAVAPHGILLWHPLDQAGASIGDSPSRRESRADDGFHETRWPRLCDLKCARAVLEREGVRVQPREIEPARFDLLKCLAQPAL